MTASWRIWKVQIPAGSFLCGVLPKLAWVFSCFLPCPKTCFIYYLVTINCPLGIKVSVCDCLSLFSLDRLQHLFEWLKWVQKIDRCGRTDKNTHLTCFGIFKLLNCSSFVVYKNIWNTSWQKKPYRTFFFTFINTQNVEQFLHLHTDGSRAAMQGASQTTRRVRFSVFPRTLQHMGVRAGGN